MNGKGLTMACCVKTMVKVGAGVLGAAVTAYLLLPEFRGVIVAVSPTLLFVLCPLSMLLCVKKEQRKNAAAGRHSSSSGKKERRTEVQTEQRDVKTS
jgi:hypothetical protein